MKADAQDIMLMVTPMGKPRMTRRDVWAERRVVLRYRAYGDELRLKLPNYSVPEVLNIEFGIPMPLSWSNKKRSELIGTPHKQKPDIDNLLKAFMDHLAPDDAYVWSASATKKWADAGYIILKQK